METYLLATSGREHTFEKHNMLRWDYSDGEMPTGWDIKNTKMFMRGFYSHLLLLLWPMTVNLVTLCKLIFLQSWRSEVWNGSNGAKIKVSEACGPSEGSGGEPHPVSSSPHCSARPLPFQLHRQPPPPPPTSAFMTTSPLFIRTPVMILWFLFGSKMEPCDCLGPSQIIQPCFPISKSLTYHTCKMSLAMFGNTFTGPGDRDLDFWGVVG